MRRAFGTWTVLCLLGIMAIAVSGCSGKNGALSQALYLVDEGSFADAIPLLEEVTVSSPENPTAWCNLGVCYLQVGNAEKAVQALREGVAIASGDPLAYEFLGRAHEAAGQLDEARDVLVTANQIGPGNPRILASLGVVELKAGNLKQSFAFTMEALDYDPAYAPALYNIAVIYRDKLKNRKLAERFFRRFLTAAPSDSRAGEARGFLNPETVRRESPAKGLVEKAKRAIEQEEYQSAFATLKEALEADPGYAEAVWHMATLADHVMGDAERAIAYYAAFEKRFPSDNRSEQAGQRSVELKAELAKKASAGDETVEVPDLLIDVAQAETAKAALTAGNAWLKKGDTAKAEAFYKRAIELDGSMASAFYNLGLLYSKGKNLAGAKTAFGTAVALNAEYTDARYMLAYTQNGMGDDVGALQNLNAVLKAKPDFARAHYLLGMILHKEKQLEAAKIHFERYAKLTGKDVL